MRITQKEKQIETPYVQHTFGDEAYRKLRSRQGWLTAAVASSIPWPPRDVCVQYAGEEYFLRGSEQDGRVSPPCITIACENSNVDEAISKIYRFTSILGWFLRGYVDVSGYTSGSHPVLYSVQRATYSTTGCAGDKVFSCNHMPIIQSENLRKALAFWREGMRLKHVHDSYAFLSFYKVIESQFASPNEKVAWFNDNIEKLTGKANDRVTQLRTDNVDVNRHLFESGRCAIAHASLTGEIVDPDIPTDRRRLSEDLVVIQELASLCIREYLGVPDEMDLYETRNRLAPWESLLDEATLISLKSGQSSDGIMSLNGLQVSVGIWPDEPIAQFTDMTLFVMDLDNGVVKVGLLNRTESVLLVFYLDFPNGRLHTSLEENGLHRDLNLLDESIVIAYHTFFHKIIGNKIAELHCQDCEPIDCEVVIPVNIIPRNPEEAVTEALEKFRRDRESLNLT